MTGICSAVISYHVRIQNSGVMSQESGVRMARKSMVLYLLDFVKIINLGYPSLINSEFGILNSEFSSYQSPFEILITVH